ncbi:hypothetical protein O181_006945 [Austropuccinia psidii MF-1]|uniref:rRNA biogenesis protein RRP36 n=1 Tax=Austropuccinia psidii MF-1 TaxID=1389203 RepID=A0A9Q3GHD0_9BASI|nr:hypothetical protein [Austropuccinia psidii MF-1]
MKKIKQVNETQLSSESDQDNKDVDYSKDVSSENEWEEDERKVRRYIAESEMEDGFGSSSDVDFNEQSQNSKVIQPKTIGALLRDRLKNQSSQKQNAQVEPEVELEGHQFVLGKRKGRTIPRHANVSIGLSQGDLSSDAEDHGRKSIAPRSNKHAPIEISSKRAVTRKRAVVPVPKIERRDPRFDPLSGTVNQELYERSFSFLKPQKQAEIEELRQKLKKAKKAHVNESEVKKLELDLHRIENQEVQNQKLEREKEALKRWKADEKAKRKEGKGAFYLKRKDKKELILADRYQYLSQDKRKLKKAIERKQKKTGAKEKKMMPIKRD